ncbi:MAG: hypothetical protein ACRD1L_08665 [Terriglobales bacterium]
MRKTLGKRPNGASYVRKTAPKDAKAASYVRKKNLDTPQRETKQGRPSEVNRTAILQQRDALQRILSQHGEWLWKPNRGLADRAEVENALAPAGRLPQLYELYKSAVNDRDFPKGDAAQIRFIAASLAAELVTRDPRGAVTARRSRQICREERAKIEKNSGRTSKR